MNTLHSKWMQTALILGACLWTVSCSKETKEVPREKAHSAQPVHKAEKKKTKLYWFIPDGTRAEPDLFDIYRWADEGKLPNIKRLMDRGAYGFSIPVYPSHTPVNYATLLTGSFPKTHGVADGPMHVPGHPLNKVSLGGFRSLARKVPAVWSNLEDHGYKVLLESLPGSTPPELKKGITIRGRWGGWGVDIHSVIFETRAKGMEGKRQALRGRSFFTPSNLTDYRHASPAQGWTDDQAGFSPPLEVELSAWGATPYARIIDSTDDGKVNYDRIQFSMDRQTILADLKQGSWSQWFPITLKVDDFSFQSSALFHVIKLDPNGFFRIRVLYDTLNRTLTQPPEAAAALRKKTGPMVDYVDNFPPQLIQYPEDRKTFLSELHRSFDWHLAAISAERELWDPDIVIHSIYNPNQMLTSRWWMGSVDPQSVHYKEIGEEERKARWEEVWGMYKRLDDVIGRIMDTVGDDALIVLSSDHGACVLNRFVHLNNVLAKHGYLKYTIDKETGAASIDWAHSKAAYLSMTGIYIDPDGLDGIWNRASGPEYEQLRREITEILLALRDENGQPVVASVTPWEKAAEVLTLPPDRVGDLVLANVPGNAWNEEITPDLSFFSPSKMAGYKQAIRPSDTKSVWTPFIIAGPGVKPGTRLAEPIRHVDQLPTILKLLGEERSEPMDGRVLTEILIQ